VAALAAAVACSETGPDADPRVNGCIGEGCNNIEGGFLDGNVPNDGGTPSDAEGGPVGFPNPLEGTTKAATLVKGGYAFVEGPVWIAGKLLFSDVSNNRIHELGADGTTVTIFRNNSNAANGNAVDPQGRLVTCEGAQRRLVRSGANAADMNVALAPTTFGGKPLNSPNDVIVRADGNIYFTDPDYSADPDAGARQPKQAVFRMAPNGANFNLTRVKEYDTLPNGIALSPDGNTLYVVDNQSHVVESGPIAADGTVGALATFKDIGAGAGNGPNGDGMAVDDAGNLYITSEAGILVYDKAGASLGTITVAGSPTNCTFGGADRKTLFITSNKAGDAPATGLYSIKLNVPCLP